MANIIWTPPSGWVEETGAHVSFKAPCDCAVAGTLVIGSNSYSIVDALGKVITGTGGAFASGAVLDFILDCENSKAYLQNAATGLTLLWTNESPNSDFPAQTISLSLSGYVAVVVVCQYDASSNYCVSTLTPVGSKGVCTLAWGTTGTLASRHYVVKTTGIAFEGAYVNNGGAYSDNMMPTHIYGIKGVQ